MQLQNEIDASHRNILLAAVLVITAGLAFAAGAGVTPLAGADDGSDGQDVTDGQDVMTWEGHVTVEKNGEVIARHHNVLTNQGQQWIVAKISNLTATGSGADLLAGGDRVANATYIALGNGTAPTATTDSLDSEITQGTLAPHAGSVTFESPDNSDGRFIVEYTFTADRDYGVVNTTALRWSGSNSDSVISGAAFGTEANILNGDSLTVTHNITIS